MVKENKLEKIIKQAIENCDNSMKEVRLLLNKALKEIHKSKKKNEKKKEQSKNILPNYKLNLKTGILESMSLTQKRNILSHIEKMISDENDKLEPKSNNLISE